MKTRSILALIFASLLLAASVSAQNRALATIDVPGSIDTRAFGINNQGQIVGLYITPDNRTHGYLLSTGRFTSIDVPGSVRTNAVGINVHGQIVGRFDTPDGRAHGYVLNDGVFTTVDVPGSAGFTLVSGINPSGEMVGRFLGVDGKFHGFFLSDGNFTIVDDPNGISIQAMALNPEGDIAGFYVDPTGRFHAFQLDHLNQPPGFGGNYTTIDPPDSNNTGTAAGVVGISPSGDVVGIYTRPSDTGGAHGFVYRNGAYTAWDFPNAPRTAICGLNPQGDMVGTYVDASGHRHGFFAPRGTVDNK